ncbi:hypothetical protein [Cellulophaga lytica]|uniref:hypothetical protein n=1 Tax=Cellulophaga lytica TaxID=979 RepID=UPI0012F96F97|nr:hypothetical protein [Cellulophaga lytica]
MKLLSKQEIIDSVTAQVKHYPKEPMYYLRINQLNCIYKVLVNDEVVAKNYSLMQYASATEINRAILKSGPQTVTYRLYPVGDLVKEEIGEGDTITTLLNSTEISIDVIRVDDINTYESITDDEKLVVKHQSKKNKETGNFIGAGLPYYEYTFTFNAQVPYEIEGWTNGIDLRKLDQKKLEHAVLDEYKKIQEIYKKNEVEKKMNKEYHLLSRLAVTEYRNKQYIKELYEELASFKNYDDKEFYPIENYEVKYSGNGRIISLRFPTILNNPDLDKRLAGKSASWYKYYVNKEWKGVRFASINLSIPKDKHKEGEFNFEFAR